jgi:hypothetical protein
MSTPDDTLPLTEA